MGYHTIDLTGTNLDGYQKLAINVLKNAKDDLEDRRSGTSYRIRRSRAYDFFRRPREGVEGSFWFWSAVVDNTMLLDWFKRLLKPYMEQYERDQSNGLRGRRKRRKRIPDIDVM